MKEEPETHHLPPRLDRRASVKFFRNVFRIMKYIWPIFSSLLVIIILLGQLIGMREGWTIGNSLYFTFITGFTIGFGDITPHYPLTKMLTVILAVIGFFFTGILVATAVEALRYTITGKSPLDRYYKEQ